MGVREVRRVWARAWEVKDWRRGAGGVVGVGGMSRRRVERRKAVFRRRGREGSEGEEDDAKRGQLERRKTTTRHSVVLEIGL